MAAILDIGQRWCKCSVCSRIQCKIFKPILPGNSSRGGSGGGGGSKCPLLLFEH